MIGDETLVLISVTITVELIASWCSIPFEAGETEDEKVISWLAEFEEVVEEELLGSEVSGEDKKAEVISVFAIERLKGFDPEHRGVKEISALL